ncbi:ubiquitin-conjugating enzyme E2-binding protein [Aspergillus tetrazonus]
MPLTTQFDQAGSTDTESLTLHAEYLPNIRQVSLQISAAGALYAYPEISLSESRRAVTVSLTLPESQEVVMETIKLPAKVTEGSRRLLSNATRSAGQGKGTITGTEREFSYRMQVNDTEFVVRDAVEEHMDSFVPWSAGDMLPTTKLRCVKCEQVILDKPINTAAPILSDENNTSHAGWLWKDLPSGNWAEMMDFWHCHKPDPHEGQDADGAAKQTIEDENSKVKGYGASNQVVATPGTVLVDVATFLVAAIECKGLKKVSKGHPKSLNVPLSEQELLCENCGTLIGMEDTIARGWRLFKASLAAEGRLEEGSLEVHPTELIVAAQLLELIERQSARRFIIHCGKEDGILIWVFNPDMRFSNSSSQHSITSQRAMKVFFQLTGDVEAILHPEPGKTSSLSLEELRLPLGTYASLITALETSNAMLPPSARFFQGSWRVGILQRFERLKRA